jgi:cell division protein FtsL
MVRRKYQKKEISLFLCSLFLGLAILTLYIWQQTEIVRLGYKMGEAERQIQTLQEEVKVLEAKKATLLSLENVERIAREKLGMIEARPEQVVFVESLF